MKRNSYKIEPIDSWFFRDGSPFNAGESGQGHARSIFPPNPPSIVGVLRASLAMAGGWSGRGRWEKSLTDVLGDGFDDLGTFRLHHATVLKGDEALYKLPANILLERQPGESKPIPRATLIPSEQATLCDLGRVRLPASRIPRAGLEPGDGVWISLEGMRSILEGHLPESGELFLESELWHEEFRIGLERDNKTRAAIKGQLYAPRHIRLEADVSLGVSFELGADWSLPRTFGFGGEARLASASSIDLWRLPQSPRELVDSRKRAAIFVLSPLSLSEHEQLRPNAPFLGMDGVTLVSACVPRPLHIGGWNSLARRPRPLTPFIAPGSVFFVSMEDKDACQEVLRLHDSRIGNHTNHGYGHVLVGTW